MQTFTDLCKHVFTDVTGYKSMHANQNPSPHLKATEFLQIHVFSFFLYWSLSSQLYSLKLALIFIHFFLSPRVRRLASTWTQSSTSSARRSIRRTWKTFSERQRRGLWPSTENRGITRGRRNVSFCESFFFLKKDKKPQEPSSSVRQIVLSVLQRLKVGGLHMFLQCYREMSDDTTGKTILQVATWSLKHPLLEGFTFICYVFYFYVFFSSWGIL